jgi:hypothetical protein
MDLSEKKIKGIFWKISARISYRVKKILLFVNSALRVVEMGDKIGRKPSKC